MKKIFVICGLFAAMLCLSGCDFIRSLAGRPVSSELESMRERRAVVLENARVEADSLRRVDSLARRAADSLALVERLAASKAAALAEIRAEHIIVKDFAQCHIVRDTADEYPYYIVIGSFSSQANAERCLSSAAPYPGKVLRSGSKLHVAALCPGTDLAEVLDSYRKLRKESFCPSNAWILIDEF